MVSMASMILQRTLKAPITLTGVGLHSGKPATVKLSPARANQGIRFVRVDQIGAPQIAGHYKNVVNTQLATTLGNGSATVSTVEHVLSALSGAGIDNVTIEVDGPEIPILDGSATPFYQAILETGFAIQAQSRPYLTLRRKVELKLGEKYAVAEPAARLEIHGSVEWSHPSVGYQEYHYVEGRTPFTEISGARTFCFLRDVEAMQKMGLAQGGSLENAVVLDDQKVLNPTGLRMNDEFVRHKVLDALGDFKLAGVPIRAYIRLHRAGHDVHRQLIAAIFADPDNFEIIDGSPIPTELTRPARVGAALASSWVASL